MKRFKFFPPLAAAIACAATLLLNPINSLAQIPGSSKSAGGMGAGFIKFFGPNTNFIARADVHVLDQNQKETTSLTMNFQVLNSQKLRMDINLAQVKSRDMSPEFVAALKKMGMDQMSTVLLPDKKVILSIYPGLRAYAETPMSKEESDAANVDYKVEKTRMGAETIDGHRCDKFNVTLTDDKGVKQHALLWLDATQFPAQIQIAEDTSTLVMKFKDVKLGRPDAANFQAPAGMAKYDSVNALMADAATHKK